MANLAEKPTTIPHFVNFILFIRISSRCHHFVVYPTRHFLSPSPHPRSGTASISHSHLASLVSSTASNTRRPIGGSTSVSIFTDFRSLSLHGMLDIRLRHLISSRFSNCVTTSATGFSSGNIHSYRITADYNKKTQCPPIICFAWCRRSAGTIQNHPLGLYSSALIELSTKHFHPQPFPSSRLTVEVHRNWHFTPHFAFIFTHDPTSTAFCISPILLQDRPGSLAICIHRLSCECKGVVFLSSPLALLFDYRSSIRLRSSAPLCPKFCWSRRVVALPAMFYQIFTLASSLHAPFMQVYSCFSGSR
jgi:hypothetical protein